MRRSKGFTLIELLIVVAIIAILAAIAVPNFLEAQIRSKVSRAKADLRSIATALESYYVDQNVYPAWASTGAGRVITDETPFTEGLTVSVNTSLGTASSANRRSFAINPGAYGTVDMFTITTPIAYMTSFPADPFATTRGCTFGYYSDPNFVGWILWCFGPDTDEGLPNSSSIDAAVESLYSPYISQPSITLITGEVDGAAYSYDPSNGTNSVGDVYRIKQ